MFNLSMDNNISDDNNTTFSKASNQAVDQLNHKHNNYLAMKIYRDRLLFSNFSDEDCNSNQNVEEYFNLDNNDSAYTNYLEQTADYSPNIPTAGVLETKSVQEDFEEKCTIKQKDHYHNRSNIQKLIFKKRNTDTASKVIKLIKLKSNGNLMWSRKRNCFVSKPNLILKVLCPMDFQVDPNLEFRFMDYIFPLKSAYFEESNSEYVSPYLGLEKIKRVVSIINDENKEKLAANFEDRDPNSPHTKTFCSKKELEYLVLWLESLGNKKAIQFRNKLMEYKDKLTMSCYHEHINKNEDIRAPDTEMLFEELGHVDNEKNWIVRQDDKTKEWVKKRPFIIRHSKLSGPLNVQKLIKLSVNYLLCDLIKIIPDSTKNVFLPLLSIKTNDVYGTYLKKFNDDPSKELFEGIKYPDLVFGSDNMLTDKNGNHVPGNFVIYYEKFVLNREVYSKSIIVFIN